MIFRLGLLVQVESLQVGGVAEVAGAADAGDVGGLFHEALDAGATGVAGLSLAGFLLGAGGGDGFVDGGGG